MFTEPELGCVTGVRFMFTQEYIGVPPSPSLTKTEGKWSWDTDFAWEL